MSSTGKQSASSRNQQDRSASSGGDRLRLNVRDHLTLLLGSAIGVALILISLFGVDDNARLQAIVLCTGLAIVLAGFGGEASGKFGAFTVGGGAAIGIVYYIAIAEVDYEEERYIAGHITNIPTEIGAVGMWSGSNRFPGYLSSAANFNRQDFRFLIQMSHLVGGSVVVSFQPDASADPDYIPPPLMSLPVSEFVDRGERGTEISLSYVWPSDELATERNDGGLTFNDIDSEATASVTLDAISAPFELVAGPLVGTAFAADSTLSEAEMRQVVDLLADNNASSRNHALFQLSLQPDLAIQLIIERLAEGGTRGIGDATTRLTLGLSSLGGGYSTGTYTLSGADLDQLIDTVDLLDHPDERVRRAMTSFLVNRRYPQLGASLALLARAADTSPQGRFNALFVLDDIFDDLEPATMWVVAREIGSLGDIAEPQTQALIQGILQKCAAAGCRQDASAEAPVRTVRSLTPIVTDAFADQTFTELEFAEVAGADAIWCASQVTTEALKAVSIVLLDSGMDLRFIGRIGGGETVDASLIRIGTATDMDAGIATFPADIDPVQREDQILRLEEGVCAAG